MSALSLFISTLTLIGAVTVVGWCEWLFCEALRRADKWADRRAKILIIQAILDHELNRGVKMHTAIDYAIYFALPGYARVEWSLE